MPIQIGQKQESDFTDPLGLLSDCHRRIERFLGVLIRICKKGDGGAIEADERAALETALTYFRNAAPKHTADEEESLFPRLRAEGRAESARECLDRLEGDHVAAGRDHEIVDSVGTQWLRDGALGEGRAREMSEALERLAGLYARHIAIEDTELFPLAAQVLPANQLADVGREMADRRGVATGAGSKMGR
jgi:hemerythrin-like domain-containing protein